MRFDVEQELLELSLERDREKLEPVLDAVDKYERCRRIRFVLTVAAVVASAPVLVWTLWLGMHEKSWLGIFILVDACVFLAFTWAVAREQLARRALRRIVNEAEQP